MKYLLLIFVLSSFTSTTKDVSDFDIAETVSRLEDMMEWMDSDMKNGRIPGELAESYIVNMRDCVNRLNPPSRNWEDR